MTEANVPSRILVADGGQRPNQIKFYRPGQMALFAKITTYPPLGQVTVVPPSRREFEFTVVLESSKSLPEQPWEVAIWYDHATCYATGNNSWRALPLQRVTACPTVLYDNRNTNVHRYTFEGNLPTPFPDDAKTYKGRKVPFTVRYRINPDEPWMWVLENFGEEDGEVILQPPPDPNFLGSGPVDVKEGWYTRKLQSEAPEARLYSVESGTTIPWTPEGAKEERKPLGSVFMSHRWFALVRIWSPWLAPRHGQQHFHLTEPAVLLSFLRTDGQHVVVLAVNGIDEVLTVFRSDDEGNIVVCARNDTGHDRKFKILAATAYSFEVANAAVMYEMRKLVRASSSYQESAQLLPTHIRHESIDSESDTILITNMADNRNPYKDDSPTPQWLASWYDSLAYCTWNSLGQDLNLDKITAALEHFEREKIHIANVIIDDNWQSLTGVQGQTNQFQRAMTDFEANSKGFPQGLKASMAKLRARFPHIRDIAVWHALMGYWGGISSDVGHIHQDYKLRPVTLAKGTPAAGSRYVVDPSDIHRWYNDFYQFLSSSGVTAVKTDVQFYLDLLTNTKDRREMMNTYQSAWTQAHLTHLSGKAISCMSQIPQILYHSFLPTNTPRIMLRNSDDFFPDVPTSHPWHIFANAHTALFVQHLNVLPDWDMFQTSHAYSGFHAASRCVSGGPIYITDYPGESDVDLIRQMTARDPRGATVVLRPSNVGKSLSVYDSYESGVVCKVGVYDGRAEVGTGMLGVFNIAEKEVNFVISVTKIPGVVVNDPARMKHGQRSKSWIVRSHMSRKITKAITPTLPVSSTSLLQANLAIRGYDIWSALPVHGPYSVGERSMQFAIVGLLGKMTGACALVESRISADQQSKDDSQEHTQRARFKLSVTMKALGTLGVWFASSGGPSSITVQDNLLVMMKGEAIPSHRVSITTEGLEGLDDAEGGDKDATQPGLIEIDTEGAWDEMKLDAGYNNEVVVDVYVS